MIQITVRDFCDLVIASCEEPRYSNRVSKVMRAGQLRGPRQLPPAAP